MVLITDKARTEMLYRYSAAAAVFAERQSQAEIDPRQVRQRDITRWSFEIVRGGRPEVQPFTALLIQYPDRDGDGPAEVAPDNMVVLHPEEIEAEDSFATPFQPAVPFLVAEYGHRTQRRKDRSRRQYEEELKVPYYLLFSPDNEELSLFRLGPKGYSAVHPNAAGRFAVPELELGAALHEGWVRFWFRGELLPLPGDLLKERDAERIARQAAEQRASVAEAELAKLREELAKAKGTGG